MTRHTTLRRRVPVAIAFVLSGCAGGVVPPATPGVQNSGGAAAVRPRLAPIVPAIPRAATPATVPAGAATAAAAGVSPGPAIRDLGITEAQAESARVAFVATCPALLRRTDLSGLTRNADWQAACDSARAAPRGQALAFLGNAFEAVQVGDGRAFATGYYEPEIAGARDHIPGYDVPIYARPTDLIEIDLGQFANDLKGRKLRGRIAGGAVTPYPDRAAIEDQGLAGRARVIAWAADPVEVFFLQIQGSGRLRLPDGSIMRIGYDNQNGRDYTGIGSLMRQRGLLAPGQASMQGIVAWLHAHPDEGRALMRENRSFVFFRELAGAPVGALGQAVTPHVTVAADTKFVPLGAPVLLSLDRADASGLWVAQDTGGAIKGANRFDTFWGAGEGAEATAGGMSARGTALLLLPIGTVARLQAAGGADGGTIAPPR
ncbi:MAG TPA: murein transglycosylase A [Sphingomonas sp.]|jgi:membrane-bound lytic murein transglycosylase A|nr:murein transglycosylase A [Sphingomonas sp.]